MSRWSAFRAEASAQRWLLLASLALNLFFAGVALAVALHRPPPAPPPPAAPADDRSPSVRIDRLAATLPPADARILLDRFGAVQASLAVTEGTSRAAQDKARKALSATPFDAAGAQAALAELRDARRGVWRIVHGVILDAAQGMSQEGRARLAAGVPPTPQPPPAQDR